MSLFRLLCAKNLLKINKCSHEPFKNYFTSKLNLSPQELLHLNTNVAKDVILFKYDNPKFFKYMGYFGLSQFCFWFYLSHFAYTTLIDAPVPKEDKDNLPWWKRINLGEQKYRNGITLFCGITAYMFLFIPYAYTIRSVRYLVLRKGGQTLSFVTYGPLNLRNLILDVPISNVSAATSRHGARVSLPLKVKGKWFHYILDMRGEFRNPNLFDATAGLQRGLK